MPKKTTPAPDTVSGESQLSFEAAYRELEQIVAQLERGDLPLEQAIELHARGQQLASMCTRQLDDAELKVRKLDIDEP
jgi:exodeoxyribonuclease VII small subunit